MTTTDGTLAPPSAAEEGEPIDSMAAQVAAKRPCPICFEPISKTAKKCIHCQSELNWKRHLSMSSTSLALLTALISVVGAVGPSIKSMFDYKGAYLSFTFVGGGSLRTVQADGRLTSGTVILLGTNKGQQAGGLIAAEVHVLWQTGGKEHQAWSELRTAGDEPVILGPGGAVSIRLLSDPEVQLEEGTTSEDLHALVTGTKPNDLDSAPFWKANCSIGLTVSNGTDGTKEMEIPARCAPLFPAFREGVEKSGS